MRLPRQTVRPSGVRPRRPDNPALQVDRHADLSLRPAFYQGGTEDCYERCELLPPGPEQEECMLDCY